MSRLQELIQRLCPNGVEFKTLGEVCLKTSTIKWKENISKNFQYIDLSSVDCSTHEISKDLLCISAENAPSRAQQLVEAEDVLFGTTRPTLMRLAYVPKELNGQICSTGYAVLRANKDLVMPRFIYFVLNTHKFLRFVEDNQEGAGYPSISFSRLINFKIPIPPREVQEEIVKILDRFSDYAAELQARKEQYEYYRNLLLTFNPAGCANGADGAQKIDVTTWGEHSYEIRWKTMEEIFEMRNGYTPSKNNPAFWEGGTIPWFRMEDIREHGRILSDAIQHITPAAVKGKGLFKADSFILATTATIGEHALIIADSLANQQFTNF